MKAHYRLVYNKSKRLNKNGEAVIYIEVAFSRDVRKFVNTKIYISPEKWSYAKNEINQNHPNYIHLNLFLKNYIAKIEKYELQLINDNKYLTPELLDEFLKGNNKTKKNFFDFAFQELLKQHINLDTAKKHETHLKIIKDFKPGLTFNDINFDFVYELDNYIKSIPNINSQNTVHSYHKTFKKFLNLAINKGLFPLENNPYLRFKVKLAKTTRENITESELSRIEQINFEFNNYLQKILDMFLFSCYTGLRYSDIVRLKLDYFDIVSPVNVTLNLPEMQKTKASVSIPLHLLFAGKALKIFTRYKLINKEQKYLFGKPIANQQINRELKLIAKQANIRKNLTFHVARHTFGTMLANKTGDPYLIKDLMGHSDIKMSMEYIHRSEKVRNDKLKNVKW